MHLPHRLLAPAALIVAGVLLPGVAHADSNTKLEDAGKRIEVQAPGTWRKETSDDAIRASGFLGVARATLNVRVFDGVASSGDALTAWKTWRDTVGATAYAPVDGDPSRLISRARLTTEYVRALAGQGRAAVAWVEVKDATATTETDAFAALSTLAWMKAPEPKGGAEPTPPKVEPRIVRDPELRVEFALPGEFSAVTGERASGRRIAVLIGPVGDDPDARLDVYRFPEFDRVEALLAWWRDGERAGWVDHVQTDASTTGLRVLVAGRTWNRLVRVCPTEAGLYALKLDVEATAQQAGSKLLDSIVKDGVKVLVPRVEPPPAPLGMKTVENPLFHLASPDGAVPDKLVDALATAQQLVAGLLPAEPWRGRKPEVIVYADQAALDVAAGVHGLEKGRACHFRPDLRRVLTHKGAAQSKDALPELCAAMARDALHRNLGFPAPFWLDRGLAEAAAASVGAGRLGTSAERWIESSRDAAVGIVDIESILWWREESSAGNNEHAAIAWAFFNFLVDPSGGAKKWEPYLRAYLDELRKTGDAAEAARSFPFEKNGELSDELKKYMRRL